MKRVLAVTTFTAACLCVAQGTLARKELKPAGTITVARATGAPVATARDFPSAIPPRYAIATIPAPAGFTNSSGVAVTASGMAVARAFGGNASRSFTFDGARSSFLAAGFMRVSDFVEPLDANDRGQVVGVSFNRQTGAQRAFVSTTSNGWYVFSGESCSYAKAINNQGTVVGLVQYAPGQPYYGFVYDAVTRQAKNIGSNISPEGINNRGHVVGQTNGSAFIFDGTTLVKLPNPPGCVISDGSAVNDAGDVAGSTYCPGQGTRPFLYTASIPKQLSTLGGTGMALGLNNAGQVVGYSETPQGRHAFLYHGGVMVDLNALIPVNSGWVLIEARQINESGQIIGHGDLDGAWMGFVLTPSY